MKRSSKPTHTTLVYLCIHFYSWSCWYRTRYCKQPSFLPSLIREVWGKLFQMLWAFKYTLLNSAWARQNGYTAAHSYSIHTLTSYLGRKKILYSGKIKILCIISKVPDFLIFNILFLFLDYSFLILQQVCYYDAVWKINLSYSWMYPEYLK